jgi:hypothetical protein
MRNSPQKSVDKIKMIHHNHLEVENRQNAQVEYFQNNSLFMGFNARHPVEFSYRGVSL